MSLLPLMLYRIIRPEVRSTPEAPAAARRALSALGPLTRDEWIVLVVFVCNAIESQTGRRFTKEPLVGIIFVGVPVGAIAGAAVGRWTVRRPTDGSSRPG